MSLDRLSSAHFVTGRLPRIIFSISTAFSSQGIEEDSLFDLSNVLTRRDNGIGVDGNGVNAALDQEFCKIRIDARRLASDRNGLAVLMSHGDEVADCPFDS